MDASAYQHFIVHLQPEMEDCKELPFIFVKSLPVNNQETMGALLEFLHQIVDKKPIDTGENFFARLFRDAHSDIAHALTDPQSASTDALRRRYTELFRLIINSAMPQQPNIIALSDTVNLARVLFFLEAFMHLGWCPVTLECQGKRAAHIYFNAMRKASLTANIDDRSTVFCYTWAAWLMAQKTEGVEERLFTQESSPVSEEFQWNDGDRIRSFYLHHLSHGNLFILERNPSLGNQPFRELEISGKSSFQFLADGKQIQSFEIEDSGRIALKKSTGYKTTYICRVNEHEQLRWTVAVLGYENSVYRMDVLKGEAGSSIGVSDFVLQIETPDLVHSAGNGLYRAASRMDELAIRFVEDQFGFEPGNRNSDGITQFKSTRGAMLGITPVYSIIAWSRGKGAHDIDKTNLTGIYDV